MEQYYDENSKGTKRGSKRLNKNKSEQDENIPQKRSRQRRDTLTRQELERLHIYAGDTSRTSTSFNMSTTQAIPEIPQPSYSMLPPLPSYSPGPRAAEMPSSSTYPTYSRSSRVSSTVTSSELIRALETSQPSASYTTHSALPKSHVPATVKMLEKTAIDRSSRPQYAAQAKPAEAYHSVAERTRAATRLLRSRMEFIQRSASDPTVHTTSETAATGAVSTTTSSPIPMEHPEATPYYLRDDSDDD